MDIDATHIYIYIYIYTHTYSYTQPMSVPIPRCLLTSRPPAILGNLNVLYLRMAVPSVSVVFRFPM